MRQKLRFNKIWLPLLALSLLTACQPFLRQQESRHCLTALPAGCRQVVMVSSIAGARSGAKLFLLEKTETGWHQTAEPVEAVAGRNGLAPVGGKREGDGRTPSGIFDLRRGFGYLPLETRLDYVLLSEDMIWVNDPSSAYYNTLVSRSVSVPPASFEVMRTGGALYRYGIVIEYNTEPITPGLGSAIFFHIWRGPGSTTAGCIAMSEKDMLKLLKWLDIAKKPVVVIGDEAACAVTP